MSDVHARVHARTQPNAHAQLFASASCTPTPYKDSWIFDMANPAKHSILELRKEKSRDAARSRRGKENYEFYELAKLLPLPAAITSQLDKASIIRLSISYLKLRDFSGHGDPPWTRDGPPPNKSVKGGPNRRRNLSAVAMEIYEGHQGTHILQSLDGFAFALANDGRFLYISETVSIYLGLSQVEMTGSSIFDYVHHQDHPELAEQLGLCLPQSWQMGKTYDMSGSVPSPGSTSDEGSSASNAPRSGTPPLHDRGYVMNPSPNKSYDRCFCLRMKSTLTKRGVHVKSAGFRVVHIIGQHRPQFSFTVSRKHPVPVLGMVCLGIALPPPTITELRIDNDTFVMRLSPEFKVIYCEPVISELMDLSSDDLTNGLLYDFCHAADLSRLRKSHVDLLAKGQVLSDYYRLMNRHGGYVWIQTCATTLFNAKSVEDQSIIAINYVLSGVEGDRCVMDTWQMSGSRNVGTDQSDHSDHGELGSDQGETSPKDRENRANSKDTEEGEGQNSDHDNRLHSPSRQTGGKVGNCSENIEVKPDLEHSVFSDDSVSATIERVEASRDGKFSRRKMEKPRKRKRELEFEEEDFMDKEITLSKNSRHCNDDSLSDIVIGNSIDNNMSPGPRSPEIVPTSVTSPIPQDLSLKSSALGVHHTTTSSSGEGHIDWRRGDNSDISSCPGVITPSSVKELEAVMNRHLPIVNNHSESTIRTNISYAGQAQKKSTIQWIGSQQQNTEPLPATNLLRSIYANRESVIRSSARPSYYSEMPANMLTPPGNDAYKDQQQTFSISHVATSKANGPYTNYTTSPLSVSMPTTTIDSYGMTPPSSVSPRDKLQSPFGDAPSYAESNSAPCGSIAPDSSANRLSVKQHTYHLSTSSSSGEYNNSSKSAYYAMSSFQNNASYPELNHNSSGNVNAYEQCSRSVLPWYPVTYSS